MKRASKPKQKTIFPLRHVRRSAPQPTPVAAPANLPQAAPDWAANILDTASEIIISTDQQRRIILFNKAAERTFGYRAEEVVGQPLDRLLPERYAGSHDRLVQQFAAGSDTARSMRLARAVAGRLKDGTEFPLEAGISKTVYQGQAILTFIGVDLTERRRAEETLAHERNVLRTLIDNLPDAIYVKDAQGRFVIKNLADARRMGAATPDESIGKTDADYYPPELAARYQADDHTVLESGQAILDREEPVVNADGRTGWVSTTKVPLRDSQGKVVGLVGIGHDITARKLAEDELQRRVEQFALLYEAGLALTRAMEPGAQLKTILKIASQAVHAERAQFFEYDETRHDLSLGMAYPEETLPASLLGVRFALGQPESLVGWVGHQRTSLSLADVEAEPRWLAAFPDTGSAILVPLLHDERLLGVFSLISPRREAFSLDDQLLLESFAAQTAVALENTRLFAETRQRLAELEAVNRVSTAMRAAQTLDQLLTEWLEVTLAVTRASGASIWLYDRQRDELQLKAARGWPQLPGAPPVAPLRRGEGFNGQVFTTGQPLISSDFRADPATAAAIRERIPAGGGMCLPIRAGEQVIGTIVIYLPAPRQVTPAVAQLLTTLSEIAGTAIQRTVLHQQTERRLQNLVALREIDQAINSSFDLQLSLSKLLEHAVAQLGVDAADVLVYNPALLLLEYTAGHGFLTQVFTHTKLRLGEGYAGQAALERVLVHVPNLAALTDNPRVAWAAAAEGFVSYFAVPLIAKGTIKGALEIFRRAPQEADEEWLDVLHTLAGQGAIAIDNDALFTGLQRSNTELALAYDATIEGWSHALDLRDKETEGHSQRVAEATVRLALAMGLHEDALAQVRWGALLHDIGKMGVPDSILLKPGPLTEDEWVVMKKHPVFAHEMLSAIHYLRSALDIPYSHHEKWDGTGYPRGLKGEEIPLSARIFAVVDVWDALTSDRPYRPAWPQPQVYDYLRSMAGTHFDPEMVRLALDSGILVKTGT